MTRSLFISLSSPPANTPPAAIVLGTPLLAEAELLIKADG